MDVCLTKIVLLEKLVSVDNVEILAKDPWIVDPMPFARLAVIELFANVTKDTKEHRPVKDVSKLDANHIMIVQATSGVTKADAKILVPILELVEPMPNVVFFTTTLFVLVLLDSSAIPALNVSRILMNVRPTLAVPMLDVSILSVLLSASVIPDAKAIP